MNTFFRYIIIFLTLAQGVFFGYAQERECDTTVWFVNIYPGHIIYELEGHSLLRIKTCDEDIAVNYGVFDFNKPGFVYRFVKGETDYMADVFSWDAMLYGYGSEGRRIVAHRLNLNGEEKARLIDLVRTNLLPENRVYRYNYVLDNCATRPLRVVEQAAGDTLQFQEIPEVTDLTTFRDYMRRYHANYPWYQFGIDLALGKGIDRTIDLREKTFAPVVLDAMLTAGVKAGERQLVETTEIYNDVPPFNVIEAPTPFWLTPDFVFWSLALILSCFVLQRVRRTAKYPRVTATVMFSLYGLAGSLIAFLVFISVHEATSPNVNLLWLNPLCFVPVVLLWIPRAAKALFIYFVFNVVMVTSVIVLWITGYQSPNPAFVPMILFDLLLSGIYVYLYAKKSKRKNALNDKN